MMNRRELLARLTALGVVGMPTTATGQTRPLNILWRNAWAVVNIGDIGHVPAALALLRHCIPGATVTLWAQQDLVFRDANGRRARFPDGSVDATTVRVLMGIVSDMSSARAKLATAMAFVKERHRFGMMQVRRTLGLPTTGTRAFPNRIYR
jgi:hypothetical protein